MAKRGFAGMSVEKRTAIAAKGGRRAQALGRAHKFTSEEAMDARAEQLAQRNLNAGVTGDTREGEQ